MTIKVLLVHIYIVQEGQVFGPSFGSEGRLRDSVARAVHIK